MKSSHLHDSRRDEETSRHAQDTTSRTQPLHQVPERKRSEFKEDLVTDHHWQSRRLRGGDVSSRSSTDHQCRRVLSKGKYDPRSRCPSGILWNISLPNKTPSRREVKPVLTVRVIGHSGKEVGTKQPDIKTTRPARTGHNLNQESRRFWRYAEGGKD